MSKILELLNYNKKREEHKKDEKRDFPHHIAPENFDSHTKEKLASTYIFNPASASEHVVKRQDKKVLPRKHPAGASKIRISQYVPWIISFLAVLLLIANIAYRGVININIEFLDKNAIRPEPNVAESRSIKKDLIPGVISNELMPISTSLVTEGRFNSYIVKRLGFYGAAIKKSRMLHDGLYLFNDGTTGWASAGIDFLEPMDFTDTTLDFFVKGVKGKESLELTLRDIESHSYMPQAHNTVFNKNMGTDWQFISVSFKEFDGPYNPNKISHIAFEFGTQTTSNKSGVSIYVKNIKIVKK